MVGSSRMRRSGSCKSASARPTRWRYPLDRAPISFRSTSLRPQSSFTSPTRSVTRRYGTPKPRTIVKVFRHSHVVIERDVFGHVAEVRSCLKRLLKNIEPRDGRAARSSWHKAGQNAHRGRFAGAVRSQKSHDFALANFEVQILDRRLTGVTFRQIFDFNHCAIFP